MEEPVTWTTSSSCANESSRCGMSTQSIATSDEESKYDTWNIFLSSLELMAYMKHASIYSCTRVPKNVQQIHMQS